MTDLKTLYRPIFFKRNRVFRVYEGGKLFHDFFGDEERDSDSPEEWMASCVSALNRGRSDPTEGLSFIEGTDLSFAELLHKHTAEMLGPEGKFDILVKLLDSAVRLPVQAHPDKAFSRRYFHSEYGKTEMWLILNTRPNACIYLGFKEKIDKAGFAAIMKKSETEKDALLPYMNRIEVKAGDIYLIPAKTIHAIGAGCLILEVQEPTDFTVTPEYRCGNYRLNEYERFLGLDENAALDCFDYDRYGAEIVLSAKKTPRVLTERSGYLAEQLIGAKDTPCFRVFRHTLHSAAAALSSAPSLYIVTEGKGRLSGAQYDRALQKGDYFFLPYCAKGKFSLHTDGFLQCAECSANTP